MAEPGSRSHFCPVLLVLLVPCTQLCRSLGSGAATLDVGAEDAGLPHGVPSSGRMSLGIVRADNTQVCLSVIMAQRHRDPSHSRLHALAGGGPFYKYLAYVGRKSPVPLASVCNNSEGSFQLQSLVGVHWSLAERVLRDGQVLPTSYRWPSIAHSPQTPTCSSLLQRQFQGTHTRNLGSEPEKRWKGAGTCSPRGLLQPHLSPRL